MNDRGRRARATMPRNCSGVTYVLPTAPLPLIQWQWSRGEGESKLRAEWFRVFASLRFKGVGSNAKMQRRRDAEKAWPRGG